MDEGPLAADRRPFPKHRGFNSSPTYTCQCGYLISSGDPCNNPDCATQARARRRQVASHPKDASWTGLFDGASRWARTPAG